MMMRAEASRTNDSERRAPLACRRSATSPCRRAAVMRAEASRTNGSEAPLACRRSALLAASCALPLLVAHGGRAGAAEAASLAERTSAKALLKPLVAPRRPGEQAFPAWLDGEWQSTASFEGYEFPSKEVNKKRLLADPDVPGFTKLSIAHVPDVGKTPVSFRLRWSGRPGGGAVVEDRAFNLRSIIDAYTGKAAVDAVEYDGARDPNRCTVRLKPGAANNAERIELFTNSRESETREADGTFFALEAFRQVTLGYSTQYGRARQLNTDYLHVRSFTPLEDGRVRCAVSTAAFIQPSNALAFTGEGNGKPPDASALFDVTRQPVALYSHVLDMRRL